jgi:hypothetical protein
LFKTERKKFEVTNATKFGEVKNIGKTRKNENQPVSYKGATLGSYPQAQNVFYTHALLPRAAAVAFLSLPSGRHRCGLPDRLTDKPVLPTDLPVILAAIRCSRLGKQVKLALVA